MGESTTLPAAALWPPESPRLAAIAPPANCGTPTAPWARLDEVTAPWASWTVPTAPAAILVLVIAPSGTPAAMSA